LSLDPGLPLAYVAQGIVFLNQKRWAEADSAFRRALTVAPGDAEAIDQYAQFLYAVGQLQAALAEIERSLRRDPLSGPGGAIRAQLLLALHRPDAAMIQIRRTLAMHPEGLLEHRVAFWVYAAQGDYGEAGRHLQIAATLMDGHPDLITMLVRGMTDPASRQAAIRTLETSPALADLRHDDVVRGAFLMALGDRDGALAALEDFASDGDSTTPQLLWYPVFDPVRGDPRFQTVLKRTGLPYAAKQPDSP
jgi:tetratricopeptide (TPR) repeat protein